MMGINERHFAPLPRDVSLEDLVPTDHFYRRLDRGKYALKKAMAGYLVSPSVPP